MTDLLRGVMLLATGLLILYLALVVVSLFIPEVITPLAHGVPMGDAGDGFLGGMQQYEYIRALFGMVAILTRRVAASAARGISSACSMGSVAILSAPASARYSSRASARRIRRSQSSLGVASEYSTRWYAEPVVIG